jgi:hypothetical protein
MRRLPAAAAAGAGGAAAVRRVPMQLVTRWPFLYICSFPLFFPNSQGNPTKSKPNPKSPVESQDKIGK